MFLRVAGTIAMSLPLGLKDFSRWLQAARLIVGAGSLIVANLVLGTRGASADYITLRSGGEIRGELLSDPNRAETKGKSRIGALVEFVSIRTLSGAMVAVDKDEVESVVRRKIVVEEYESLRRSCPNTVEAQWDLAEWCRQKSLAKERLSHLHAVVSLDPDHVAAHRGLGHIKDRQGRWATHDEVMISRGYIKHKGKYVLPQELELIQQDERVTEAEKGWFKRVRMWHGWLDSDRPDRQADALTQLKAVQDPDAVPALTRYFKAVPNEEQRMLYVEILTRIIGDKPVRSLVQQSLWDESKAIRGAAIAGVLRKDAGKAVPDYLRALKHGLNFIVNRAGDALGQLGNDAVLPQLINALVTRHVYTELVPDGGTGVTTSGGMAPVGQSNLPPNVDILLSTGQLPQGVRVDYPATPVRMKEITYEKDEQNPSVLGALSLLTGQDFAFDEAAWRRWYNTQRNSGGAKKKKPKL
jgi:hypothetical protein